MTELAGQGDDHVSSLLASYTLGANIEILSLGGGALNGTGNALHNRMFGNSLDNKLDGGGGIDELNGAGGNDSLLGGLGSDHLNGDSGNDKLKGGADVDFLNGGAGADVMKAKPGRMGSSIASMTRPSWRRSAAIRSSPSRAASTRSS